MIIITKRNLLKEQLFENLQERIDCLYKSHSVIMFELTMEMIHSYIRQKYSRAYHKLLSDEIYKLSMKGESLNERNK